MLYLVTGEVRLGKTRWLCDVVGRLARAGVVPYGVLAPGVWRALSDGAGEASGFEKLGIDNVLLPQGERVHLARRRDLADVADLASEDEAAGSASLDWVMDRVALARVEDHFRALAAMPPDGPCAPGVLVVDELGRLELSRDAGLLSARALAEAGPGPRWRSCLVVVRESLLPLALERMRPAWPGVRVVRPGGCDHESLAREVVGEIASELRRWSM